MKVRTTITLPEQLLQAARLHAVHQQKPLSVVIEEALEEKLFQKKDPKKQRKDPMSVLGVFKLGAGKIYETRSDLYDEHIRRKMGF